MSHTIELSDEQYTTLARVAAERGEPIAAVVTEAAEALRDRMREPRYFDNVDEWFRHLGATEEEIAEGERIFQERQAQLGESDADV